MGIKRILYFTIVSFLLLISTFNIYSQVGANVVGSNSAQTNSITLPQGNIYYCIAASDSDAYPILISNTQNIPTPSPFQQDIAICNGSINISNNFAYINNATLFNEIDPNGQNVYFVNSSGNMLYSWYEGRFINGSTYCDVWWINLPNGIPANSNITIYMYIGPNSVDYYQQYYPYVGASPQVISGYDNGQDIFIAYGYFDNTFDGWTRHIYSGSFSPTATSNGIEMINNNGNEGTYILPPNNGNIPKIPLIVEEAWSDSNYWGSNVIALFGNIDQQILVSSIGSTYGGDTPASNLSTLAEYNQDGGYFYLKSAVTDTVLGNASSSIFYWDHGTFYSYLIVNSTYAQTGYYYYSSNQVWVPLTLLDTYSVNNNGYIYSNLNYNPFQYGTLEISAGTDGSGVYQYIEWVVARSYPPNGVMPSISLLSNTITPNFNVLVGNSNSIIGESNNNVCSFNSTNLYNVIGGISINNYSIPIVLYNSTNTYTTTTTQTISFNVQNQNETVLILLSLSGNGINGGYISSVALPTGCSQLFLTSSGNSASVYAAECKDLSPGSYSVSYTINSNQGSYVSVLVLGFPVFTFDITGPNSIYLYSGSSNSTAIYVNQLTGNTPLSVTLSCSTSNSNLQCSLSSTQVTPNTSITLTVTASSSITPGTYSVTISGTAQNGVTNSTTITVIPIVNPEIYIISPSNNSISNYYQLNISFYTNYPNVNVTINGNTYNISVTPGNNIIQLNYENSSYNLPGLYNIIPNGGNITIQLSTSNPEGIINSTGIYVYTLPSPIFNVSYVYPTPSNGTQENIWLLEINANVYDNTLGQDYCNIQLLNQTSNQWVTIANSCSDILYNGILQQYAKLNSNGYYSIWYRVYAYNNYGLNQSTNPQVIYISQNAYNVSVVNNTLSNTQIQGIIDSAINSSIPIIIFSPGVYLVNLVINPQGKNITLLGENTIFEPANPGLPVIDILSSNVTIQNININTNLFAINVENGELNLINSNINSGLFGIDVKNPSIVNVYNSTINGNIGGIYGDIQNSTIENTNIQSSVWGIYDDNPYNVIINNSNINGQIFGIDFDGNAINNIIENSNIISNIFGIKINNGNNNNIINNNIQSNIFGIYLTSSGNNIENDYIKVGQVFGLYITQPNNIINVTTNGGLFGYYLTGNATNISLYNSQLGIEIYGSGYIDNLTTSTGSVNVYYNNSQGFINSLSSIISSTNVNNVLYNYYEGISIIGNINGNITFINLPSATSYIVEKIVGGNGNIISTNSTFIPQGFGNYELFYS